MFKSTRAEAVGVGMSGREQSSDASDRDEGRQPAFTGRIAEWSARRRWWVVAASVMTVVLAMVVLSNFETKTLDGDSGGVGDSDKADRLIDERFAADRKAEREAAGEGEQRGRTELLVFASEALDVDSALYRAEVEQLVEDLSALPEVVSVVSYYDTESPEMVSGDRRALLAHVTIRGDDTEHNIAVALETVHAAREASNGLQIAMTGNVNSQIEKIFEEDFARILMVTMVLGLVILLIAFRAAVAALIPLIMAIGSIFTAMAVAALISQAYSLAQEYQEMILLMGLAVGIDYSLFIVSRFRSERAAGRDKLDAISVASDTTGRAVFYAGITVVVSLAGLILTYNPIFISLALAAIVVVLIAIVASLTLLPAILSVLGDKVNWLRIPFLGRGEEGGGIWAAVADKVLAKPAVFAIVTTGALIAMASPMASLNLGFNQSASGLPDAVDAKQAYLMLEEYFTLGLTDPAVVVIDAKDAPVADVKAAVDSLIERVGQDSAFAGPFKSRSNSAHDVMVVTVPLSGALEGDEAKDALRVLRDQIIPAAFAGYDAPVYVTGPTAASVDFVNNMYGRAPWVFGFVLGLSFLLLLVMFRSIVIPIKAVLLNLLSAGAAYGVLVMVFQWGWGIGVLNSAEATGIIMAWLPLFLFGILFGLSMDYHMLLLSRIKEAHDQGHGNEESVSTGIKLTAGQITSAAAIMVGVFGAFAMGRVKGLQQFGLGLGVAVLVDATVIRSVLLPATMKLLGDWNWYLPSWLEWLPQMRVEGESAEPKTDMFPAVRPNGGQPAHDAASPAE